MCCWPVSQTSGFGKFSFASSMQERKWASSLRPGKGDKSLFGGNSYPRKQDMVMVSFSRSLGLTSCHLSFLHWTRERHFSLGSCPITELDFSMLGFGIFNVSL